MASVMLAYRPLSARSASGVEGRWRHLLQHRAAYETARAVLAAHGERGPELSEHSLLAPANLDILPLLAIAASDYAEFAEPEGDRRPRTPIQLYEDVLTEPTERPESRAPLLERLQHPAWFGAPVSFADMLYGRRPEICVAVCDPSALASLMGRLDYRFQQIVVFESFVSREDVPELPAERVVFLERLMAGEVERNRTQLDDPAARNGIWQSMLAPEEVVDLEPFVPFGLGIEMILRGK